jgi:hypothetical protein
MLRLRVALILFAVAALATCSGDETNPDAGTLLDSGVALDAGNDAGPQDAGTSDSGTDAGPLDAGNDAGTGDAGSDAGTADAGSDAGTDAGAHDAGTQDAGSDAGTVDGGVDAGPIDAGPQCSSVGTACFPAASTCCSGTSCEQLVGSTSSVCHPAESDGDGGICISQGNTCAISAPCCTTCYQNFCCQLDGEPCNNGITCCSGYCEPSSHTCLTL